MEVTEDGLARRLEALLPHLNELQRRVVAGAMAEMLGRGGKSAVAVASGMSRNTVTEVVTEVETGIEPSTRLRAPGGGDKSLLDTQPGLLVALDELVHPETRGNPMSALRWTNKSSTKLAAELVSQGFEVSSRSVLRLLHRLGYSLQANAKVTEGRQHEDRDAQFGYLNEMATTFIADGQPVISDVFNNEGWVNVGDAADTAEFAVESIRRWWHQMGRERFEDADRLLITADAGESNGYRVRTW
jgi:transposase